MSTRAELIERSEEAAAAWDPRDGNFAVAPALDALRLAILAQLADDVSLVGPQAPPIWARVELFGHTVRYGQLREVKVAGQTWLELVEPAFWADPSASGPPTFEETRKRYHPNAIYAIEERTEVEVIETLRRTKGLDLPDTDGPVF